MKSGKKTARTTYIEEIVDTTEKAGSAEAINTAEITETIKKSETVETPKTTEKLEITEIVKPRKRTPRTTLIIETD